MHYPITIIVTSNFNILWTLLYILVIRRGFLEKTYGIPFVALIFNLTWDVYSSLWVGHAPPMPQPIVNGFYMIIDLIILYQVFRHRETHLSHIPANQFYVLIAITTFFSFLVMRAFILDTNDPANIQAGVITTLINGALFITMFYARPNLEGQSLYIALFKLFGTFPFYLWLYLAPQAEMNGVMDFPSTNVLPMLYLAVFVLDLLYAILVYQRARSLGINPWRRF